MILLREITIGSNYDEDIHRTIIIFVLTISALFLNGCGSDDDTTGDTSTVTTVDTITVTTEDTSTEVTTVTTEDTSAVTTEDTSADTTVESNMNAIGEAAETITALVQEVSEAENTDNVTTQQNPSEVTQKTNYDTTSSNHE